MSPLLSRRDLLAAGSGACGAIALLGLSATPTLASDDQSTDPAKRDAGFPRQDLSAVEEVVRYSHFDLERVKLLVTARPALAKATWDWGFGDWESALGAASHTGQRDIAEFLMEHGARPDLFTFAMMGDLDALRGMIAAHPGIQSIPGPHGITLMAHARAGGPRAEPVARFLEELGGADVGGTDLAVSDDEKRRLLGTYAFGNDPTERLEVLDKRGELRIKRVGQVGRRLLRTGELEYHPMGAPAVRVLFDRGDAVPRLTIVDAALTVVAKRVTGP
jgi:hypothetical protein